MSTFDGVLLEYPLISVDRFLKGNYLSTAYFLSHCHIDHMRGLSDTRFCSLLKRRLYSKIYLSSISRMLLINDSRYSHLSEYLEVIPLEVPTLIPIHDDYGSQAYNVVVTCLVAGHCPGSVMFLFEGPQGNILYTGDFRIEKGGAARLPHLCSSSGKMKPIKTLYLDTTFCNTRSLYFPSRDQSVEAIISLIKPWIAKGKDHVMYLRCPAKYGYENIFTTVYEVLKMKVHVDPEKYERYRNIEDLEKSTTTDGSITQIHACYYKDFEGKTDTNGCTPCGYFAEDGKKVKLQVIKPCVLSFSENVDLNDIMCCNKIGDMLMFRVCFSTHSSLTELWDLVSYVQPQKIHANVIPKGELEDYVLHLLTPLIEKKTTVSENVLQLPPLGVLRFSGMASPAVSTGSFEYHYEGNEEQTTSAKEQLVWHFDPSPGEENNIVEIFSDSCSSSSSDTENSNDEYSRKDSSSEMDLISSGELGSFVSNEVKNEECQKSISSIAEGHDTKCLPSSGARINDLAKDQLLNGTHTDKDECINSTSNILDNILEGLSFSCDLENNEQNIATRKLINHGLSEQPSVKFANNNLCTESARDNETSEENFSSSHIFEKDSIPESFLSKIISPCELCDKNNPNVPLHGLENNAENQCSLHKLNSSYKSINDKQKTGIPKENVNSCTQKNSNSVCQVENSTFEDHIPASELEPLFNSQLFKHDSVNSQLKQNGTKNCNASMNKLINISERYTPCDQQVNEKHDSLPCELSNKVSAETISYDLKGISQDYSLSLQGQNFVSREDKAAAEINGKSISLNGNSKILAGDADMHNSDIEWRYSPLPSCSVSSLASTSDKILSHHPHTPEKVFVSNQLPRKEVFLSSQLPRKEVLHSSQLPQKETSLFQEILCDHKSSLDVVFPNENLDSNAVTVHGKIVEKSKDCDRSENIHNSSPLSPFSAIINAHSVEKHLDTFPSMSSALCDNFCVGVVKDTVISNASCDILLKTTVTDSRNTRAASSESVSSVTSTADRHLHYVIDIMESLSNFSDDNSSSNDLHVESTYKTFHDCDRNDTYSKVDNELKSGVTDASDIEITSSPEILLVKPKPINNILTSLPFSNGEQRLNFMEASNNKFSGIKWSPIKRKDEEPYEIVLSSDSENEVPPSPPVTLKKSYQVKKKLKV